MREKFYFSSTKSMKIKQPKIPICKNVTAKNLNFDCVSDGWYNCYYFFLLFLLFLFRVRQLEHLTVRTMYITIYKF